MAADNVVFSSACLSGCQESWPQSSVQEALVMFQASKVLRGDRDFEPEPGTWKRQPPAHSARKRRQDTSEQLQSELLRGEPGLLGPTGHVGLSPHQKHSPLEMGFAWVAPVESPRNQNKTYTRVGPGVGLGVVAPEKPLAPILRLATRAMFKTDHSRPWPKFGHRDSYGTWSDYPRHGYLTKRSRPCAAKARSGCEAESLASR